MNINDITTELGVREYYKKFPNTKKYGKKGFGKVFEVVKTVTNTKFMRPWSVLGYVRDYAKAGDGLWELSKKANIKNANLISMNFRDAHKIPLVKEIQDKYNLTNDDIGLINTLLSANESDNLRIKKTLNYHGDNYKKAELEERFLNGDDFNIDALMMELLGKTETDDKKEYGTQIPNKVLEALWSYPAYGDNSLTTENLKVILLICRWTYGFSDKKSDTGRRKKHILSIRFIADGEDRGLSIKGLNMNEKNVSRSLKKLIRMKIVKKEYFGRGKPQTLGINENVDVWAKPSDIVSRNPSGRRGKKPWIKPSIVSYAPDHPQYNEMMELFKSEGLDDTR